MLSFPCSAGCDAVQAAWSRRVLREDTGDMNRGHAETHLRQLAEAELRRANAPGAPGRGHAGRLPLVAQALIAVGAVDVGTADQIQAELDLALAARYQAAGATPQQLARLIGVRPPRAVTETFTASRQAPWRVVPAGQVIRIRDGEIRGELGLLAYLQTTHGGRFTTAGWMHGPAPGPAPSRRVLSCPSPASSPRPMTRALATLSASASGPGLPVPRCGRACSTCVRTRRMRSAGSTCVPLPASPPRAFTWTRGTRRSRRRRSP